MTLSYTLIVTGPAYGTQGSATAVRFAKALVASGHELKAVFFYQDGTTQANSLLYPASDEPNRYQQWSEFAQQHAVPLLVCVAAGERRGVIGDAQSKANGWQTHNLVAPFVVAGLAEMTMSMLQSDRVVQL